MTSLQGFALPGIQGDYRFRTVTRDRDLQIPFGYVGQDAVKGNRNIPQLLLISVPLAWKRHEIGKRAGAWIETHGVINVSVCRVEQESDPVLRQRREMQMKRGMPRLYPAFSHLWAHMSQ